MTKAWDKYNETIHDLYKVQGKTLEDTMKIMKEQHGFDASIRAYRAKFKKWGWKKYNKQKLSEHGPQTRPLGVASPHEALLMTPVQSSEGESSKRGRAIARATNGPNLSYALQSPDVGYPFVSPDEYRGVSGPSSPTLSTPAYPHHHMTTHNYGQHMQESFPNPQFLASPPPQHNNGVPRWQDYNQQAQQQQQQQQEQNMFYRPILPAPHHNGQHQTLHVHTADARFAALLTSDSPASLMSSDQRVNYIINNIYQLQEVGRLNERCFSVSGQLLTAFEFFVQRSTPQGSAGSHVSLQEVHDFCRVCATFVQQGADMTRIVPHGFAQTIQITLGSPDAAVAIESAVLCHQQEPEDGGLTFPPWVSVWISACQQGLNRNSTELYEHLNALSYWLGKNIHQNFRDIIPELASPSPYATPRSSTTQQPNQTKWDQQ